MTGEEDTPSLPPSDTLDDLFGMPEIDDCDRKDLELVAGFVADKVTAARERFQQHSADANLDGAQDALRDLHGWRVCQRQIQCARRSPLTVHIDTLVLADCYQTLFEDPSIETFVYLTGIRLAPGEVTINRRLRLDHETQSAVRAAGDPTASFATLRALDACGHPLLGHCHNHTHQGADGLQPSSTDRDYQQRLEDGHYEAIGLIMTEDGYVRLFTNDLPTEITTHGNNVKRLDDDRLYLEEQARNASDRLDRANTGDGDSDRHGDGSDGNGSARTDRRIRSDGAGECTSTLSWSWWSWW